MDSPVELAARTALNRSMELNGDRMPAERKFAMVDPQEFGELKAEVAALRRDNDRLLELLEKMNERLVGIEKNLSEARGGWRVLVFVGGVIGGLITWVMTHLQQLLGR